MKKHNALRWLTGFAALLLLLSGCATGGAPAASPAGEAPPVQDQTNATPWWETGEGYTFTDSTGAEVTLTAQPQKVAVLFSSFAEVWQLAGGTVSVTVGETVERGFAAQEDVELVDGGAGKTIDRELLVAYQPDFVIVSADIEAQAETADFLRETGIPAAKFIVECFDDYLRMLQICTDITGDADAYAENGAAVAQEVAAVQEEAARLAAQGEAREILFIRAGSQASATKAKTQEDNFVCKMLAELGTYNIAENAPVLLDGLSQEEVVRCDPDYIFVTTMGSEADAVAYMESVFASDGWSSLTAVEQGNYAFLPKDLFHFKPNARWAEAYRYLAELLYPGMEENA